MNFLRGVAKRMAEINKPLRWITPTGMPWCNRYYVPNIKSIPYYTSRGRKYHKVTVGDTDDISLYDAVRAIAANVIHACDASHAVLTILACAAEKIELATNHDCFSMLACDADRFNEIVRQQFVKMYGENDILEQIHRSATDDGAVGLPPIPQRGDLDLRSVLKADYFVS